MEIAYAVDAAVYEFPVDSMVCSTQRRLVFVKTSSKGLQYVDSFGIDIWNASSGKSIPFLTFGRYGKLLQMEVSLNFCYVSKVINSRYCWHVLRDQHWRWLPMSVCLSVVRLSIICPLSVVLSYLEN